jgi:dihydrofolate reductase
MPALFARFDTVVMGRKSYEAARAMGEAGSTGLPTIVCSSTLRQEDCPGVTVAEDAATAVRALKAAPGRDIWLVGGGDLFRSLLAERLVDSIQVAIVPVLLGGGLPLLPLPAGEARLVLKTHRAYQKSGTVMLEYDVVAA